MPAPIRTREGFAALAESRERHRSGPVWVVRADDPDGVPGRPQVAYAIGRAVGNAVVRNRLRRRLRALMDELAARDGLTGRYLVGVRPAAVELTFDSLREHLDRALGAFR